MDDEAIKAVGKLKDRDQAPKNVGEIRQILGLLSYHRRYVQNFARLSKPLSDLLVASEKTSLEKGLSSKTPIVWTEKEQKALEELINILVNPPILAYPDYSEDAE